MQTDIILSARNAMFLQLAQSLLQSPKSSLSSIVSSLYDRQPDLLHLATFSSITSRHSTSASTLYVLRIPAERQEDMANSIETGSDVLSTAMRHIYYGSTDLLS